MITEYPFEHRRYDQSKYEPFWAAAAALDLSLSLHTATRRQGKIRGAARPCTLLTLSELSFTIREVLFGFGPHAP